MTVFITVGLATSKTMQINYVNYVIIHVYNVLKITYVKNVNLIIPSKTTIVYPPANKDNILTLLNHVNLAIQHVQLVITPGQIIVIAVNKEITSKTSLYVYNHVQQALLTTMSLELAKNVI